MPSSNYDIKGGGDAFNQVVQDVDVEGAVKGVATAEAHGLLNKAFGGDLYQTFDQTTKTDLDVSAKGGRGGNDNLGDSATTISL